MFGGNAAFDPVQLSWAGWPVSGPRSLLSCCKFTSEHAWHPLVHHSSSGHLSGLLPTDPEHEFLWRVSHTSLGKGHARGLEDLGSKLLAAVEMVTARERQSLRQQRTGAPPAGGQKK